MTIQSFSHRKKINIVFSIKKQIAKAKTSTAHFTGNFQCRNEQLYNIS